MNQYNNLKKNERIVWKYKPLSELINTTEVKKEDLQSALDNAYINGLSHLP